MLFKILNLQQFPHEMLCAVNNLSEIRRPVAHFCGSKSKQHKKFHFKTKWTEVTLEVITRFVNEIVKVTISVILHSNCRTRLSLGENPNRFSYCKHHSLRVTAEWFFKRPTHQMSHLLTHPLVSVISHIFLTNRNWGAKATL